MAVEESGDVSAEVHVEVSGTDQLRDAAGAAQDLSEGLDEVDASADAASGSVQELAGELDELGDAGPGIEEDAAEIGHIRDNAAEASPAVAALAAELDSLDASSRGIQSGGLYSTLAELRDAMQDMERGEELTIYRGSQGGWGINPPSEELEDELGNISRIANSPATAAAITQQIEVIEREMGTFETDAAKYLHTVQDIESGIRSAGLGADEAASALGSGGLGGSMDDLSGSVEDVDTVIARLEGQLFLGNAAASAFEDGTYDASAAVQVLAGSMADAEGSINDVEEALGGAGGASGGLFESIGASLGPLSGISGQGALITSLIAAVAGVAPAAMALGGGATGFGALGAPAILEVAKAYEAVSSAQKAYRTAALTERNDPTTENLAAEKTALAQLKAAWQEVPGDVRPAVRAIGELGTTWTQDAKKSGIYKDVLTDIPKAISDVTGAVPSLSKLGQAFSPEVTRMLADIGKFEQSRGLRAFVGDLDKEMPGAASSLHTVADAIGGLATDLAKPGFAKTGNEFITAIGSALKGLTPAAVTGLEAGLKGLSGALDEAGTHGAALNTVVTDLVKLEKINLSNLAAAGSDLGEVLGPAERLYDTFSGLVTKLSGGKESVSKAAEEALGQMGVGSDSPVMKFFRDLDSQSSAAGAKAGHAYGTALHQALGNLPANAPVTGNARTAASGLQKSLDDATKNVKLHGVTVDLADAKLSGLTALGSVLGKAGTTAGTDYDRALARAIDAGSSQVTAGTDALLRDVEHALAGMDAAGRTAGTALGNGLAAGIEASTPAAVAAATRMADEVTAAVRAAHQTQSPSKLFRQIGRDDIAGLVLGLEDGELKLAAVIKELDPTKHLRQLIDKAETFGKAVASAAESGASLSTLYGETKAGIYQSQEQAPVYGNLAGAMKASLNQIRAFDKDIRELHNRGLSAGLVRQLLQEGPAAGLPQAASILAGGSSYIRELDKLESEISSSSQKLGATGSDAIFGKRIGDDVANGMARGVHEIAAAIKGQKSETTIHLTLDVPVKIDGKQIARVTQTYTLRRANRNISSGLKLAGRGA